MHFFLSASLRYALAFGRDEFKSSRFLTQGSPTSGPPWAVLCRAYGTSFVASQLRGSLLAEC
jgi:hypothetical protein